MKLSFEDYLKKENLSQHTISVYLWTVDYFISNYKDFNTENLHAYKGYLMEFFKPKTVNLALHFRILTIMLIYNLVNHDLLNYILLYAIYKNRPRILIRCAVCSIR